MGGAIGITAVYPLDTVKSRLQTSGKATYSGTIHVLTSMTSTEGVRHQAQQPCQSLAEYLEEITLRRPSEVVPDSTSSGFAVSASGRRGCNS